MNKKALDQFLQFSDERDKLTNRKGEIDEAHRVCIQSNSTDKKIIRISFSILLI